MLELMHLANLVSSANKNGSADRILSGRSLIKLKNNSGPSTLPCGTPESTGRRSDEQLDT